MSALRVEERSSTPVSIRPATQGDIDAVLRIERAAFSDPWSRASFTSIVGDPRVYFVVAEHAPEVVGYVAAWLIPPEGEIATIAVLPERRGEGSGAALLDSALDAARLRGVLHLYLEVRESNLAAQALYRSRGFAEIGVRHNYYRNPPEHARVMRVTLEPPAGR